MQILSAFKVELMPTGEQARDMRRFAGACRFVFNKALALQNENYRNGGKYIGYVPMAKHLTAWRNSVDTPWMAETPSSAQQSALKELDVAYKNFFQKTAAFPSFTPKRQSPA